MTNLQEALLLTVLAGGAIPVGGAIATVEHIRPAWLEEEFRHTVIAFGGGALFAAVALILVPRGIGGLSKLAVLSAFVAGAIVFLVTSCFFAKKGGAVSQSIAMLLDFIPEAMALGAVLSDDAPTALLLAFLIGLQNLPEGFNAYREMKAGGYGSRRTILRIFTLLAFVGPLSAYVGMTFLTEHESLLHWIMLFCAGGILYLIFQDIAPQAKLKRSWLPSLGAVAGFLLGLIGQMITT
jgi:ZIP family zinc transporter